MMLTMRSRLITITSVLILAFSFAARADVLADRPTELSASQTTQNTGAVVISDIPSAGGSSSGITEISGAPAGTTSGTVISNPEGVSSNISSGNVQNNTAIEIGPVVGNLPSQTQAYIQMPSSGQQTAQTAAETTAPQTGVQSIRPAEEAPLVQGEPEGMAAPENEMIQVEGPVIGDGTALNEGAPTEAASTESSSEAAAQPEKKETLPQPAGPGSQRVTLDFGIVSPTHSMGSQCLAVGSVELSDGSWQALGYDACIHAPYFKLIRETTDSLGTAWYVVKCNGTRFGNAHTNDGTRATELWLLKSDCTCKNYINLPTANAARGKIVAAALSLLGCKYSYGGSGPDAFDCSGLVRYVYKQAGLTVPRTSSELCAMDGQIPIEKLRPGDICARNGHAGIYIGNDIFIHASESSVGVVAEYLSSYNTVNRFTRYINAVGD